MTDEMAAAADLTRALRRFDAATRQATILSRFASYHPPGTEEYVPCLYFGDQPNTALIVRTTHMEQVDRKDVSVLLGMTR